MTEHPGISNDGHCEGLADGETKEISFNEGQKMIEVF